jgi:hypothetical protein
MDAVVGSTNRVVKTGQILFAVGLVGIGIEYFFFVQFVPMVAPHWPAWVPDISSGHTLLGWR